MSLEGRFGGFGLLDPKISEEWIYIKRVGKGGNPIAIKPRMANQDPTVDGRAGGSAV